MQSQRRYTFKRKTLEIGPVAFSEPGKIPTREDTSWMEVEYLMTDWAINQHESTTPRQYLESKGMTPSKIKEVFKVAPQALWKEKRQDFKDNLMKNTVKSQLDFITEMNDLHLRSAKVGMVKAIEMLHKMKIEAYTDKDGVIKYRRFKTTDLKNCMESLAIAQKIMRTALGLPSDEGAIHVWQQLNVTQTHSEKAGAEVEDAVSKAEKIFTYDDIKALIKAKRDGDIIDVEATATIEETVSVSG